MTISADKVAPIAVVLAFVGYCVWPSVPALLSDPPRSKPSEKIEEIPVALFSPELAPPPTRNPWGGLDAETLAAKEADEKKRSSELAEKLAKSLAEPDEAKPTVAPTDLLKELTLDATCIGGGQRLAVINNRLYSMNQMLLETNPQAPPCKIVEVRPYEVLLSCQGKTLALKYSSAAPRAASDSQAGDQEAAASEDAAEESTGEKTGNKKKASGSKSNTKQRKAGV